MGHRMDSAPLFFSLTPHGRLVLIHDADAPHLDSGLADRLLQAFERGSGHGLLLLGADEAGTALPPVLLLLARIRRALRDRALHPAG